ncbi:response regulator transcription factor [Bacillus sp. SCS-151]|uniref:response regulator transcription factor n=1 Tax=Nanhaiella sioensis TaxID=3115293 RepID=UPI00397C2E81
MAKKILYIEDDLEIGTWVSACLTECGYDITWVKSGDEAINYAEQIDLVISDVMLPGLDGFTVGQRLKMKFPETPVMMLSARTAVEDKLQGLSFADDYVTKPFHIDELHARVEVLLRRFGKSSQQMIKLHHLDVFINESRIINTCNNDEIILTGKQHKIFFYLLDNLNQILTKEQIFEAVWGEQYIEGDKTLMVHIRYIREKIEQNPSEPVVIETIRGIGYRIKQ